MDQEEAMFGTEIKPKKKPNYTKMFALGLGGLIGLSHIGMIGTLMNRESKLSSINLPVVLIHHIKQMLVMKGIT